MLPRLLLISATAIAAGAVYTTMVPQSQVNLNEPCRAEALHGTQKTIVRATSLLDLAARADRSDAAFEAVDPVRVNSI
jgi:hypothetical protein